MIGLNWIGSDHISNVCIYALNKNTNRLLFLADDDSLARIYLLFIRSVWNGGDMTNRTVTFDYISEEYCAQDIVDHKMCARASERPLESTLSTKNVLDT